MLPKMDSKENPNPYPNMAVAVKEELIESPEMAVPVLPRPMEGLHDQGPPPFLTKTYDVVDDPSTDGIVSWSLDSNSFVVWDLYAFSMTLLPKYFKHNNFSSFVRQLNTYGFRKVEPDRWEFANEGFLRGHKHLLKTIKRRRPPSHPPAQPPALAAFLEVGQFGHDGEIDRLKRDKNILMAELAKLRQEQQNTRAHLKAMEERLRETEQRQQRMMAFLARAMRNPDFLQQLARQKDGRKELKEAISKKRRRPIEHGRPPRGLKELHHHEVPELEALAMEMQGFRREQQEEVEVDVELNDEFWEELLNDGISEEKGNAELEARGDEDVNYLSERLGYLSSSSPKVAS
uniref:Heat shock transcription factor A2b n=1 Tax=Narcissus tazetta subsp. chinensis TaxID=391288 RepID=A0A411JIH4_NARTA|nr:heat shock transcription factor A2b [Narcissus tazetta subsp. chinensis]